MKLDYHLDSNQEYCLEIELSSALLEQVLKTLAQQIHNHDMEDLVFVLLLISNEVKVRNACCNKLMSHELLFPLSLWINLLSQKSITCLWYLSAFS